MKFGRVPSVGWRYVDFLQATVEVLRDYGRMAEIAERVLAGEAVDETLAVASSFFREEGGAPYAFCRADPTAAAVDRRLASTRVVEGARAYMEWFYRGWDRLTKEESEVLTLFYCGLEEGEDVRERVVGFAAERGLSVGGVHRRRVEALTKLTKALYFSK